MVRPPDDDREPQAMKPGAVLRMLLPSFLVSIALCVVGFVLIAHHQRTVGAILVVIGAGAGLLFRMRLMMRSQRR